MRTLLAGTLAAATLFAVSDCGAQAFSTPRDWSFALGFGLTYGGDKLATARFSDGSSSSIRAGGLVQVGAGVLWQPVDGSVAVQSTFNYHIDDVSASNGSLRFTRYPLEVLGFYTGLPGWRFGVGPRFVFAPGLKVNVPGDDSKITFDDTIGAVAEVGYRFDNYMWLNFRLTGEKYKLKSVTGPAATPDSNVSGNSVGMNVVMYF